MKILLVEDNKTLCATLKHGLEELKHIVEYVHTGRDGIDCAKSPRYDVIILDVGLPDIDGLEVCCELRKCSVSTPVLILTGQKKKIGDKVYGLNAGADDYLCKPFDIKELEARIQALHRRNSSQKSMVIEGGGISLDKVDHTVKVRGRCIKLTTAEYRVLEFMMDNPDKLLTYEVIMQHIWHADIDNEFNTFDVHLCRLRRKLGFARGKCPIKNLYGRGYRFAP